MTPTDEQKPTAKPRKTPPRANRVTGPQPKSDMGPRSISQMLSETGTSGTKNFSGIITDEYLPALSMYQAPLVYDKMRRSDGTVAALISAYTMPMRSSKWYIQPEDDSPQAVEYADFLHDNLWSYGEQTFDDFAREAFTYLPFGFSWFEKVFDWMEGPWQGKLGWWKFAFRYQNTRFRWNFKPTTGANGVIHRRFDSVTQFAPPDYQMVDIPAEKCMIFSHNREGDNLDGIALLRSVYKHWMIKDTLYKLQGIGLERASIGVPFARWLQDVAPDTLTYVTQMLENLRTDDQASIQFDGNEVEIGYLANKFDAQAMQLAIEHHDGKILESGLAQFVNLGTRSSGTTGSYALSDSQSQMFLDALNGEANYFASGFHRQGTMQLMEYNFPAIERALMPRLAHGDIGNRGVNNLAMAVNAFAQYGFLSPDPRTENMIRQVIDFPERDEDYHIQQAMDALNADTGPEEGPVNTTKKAQPTTPPNAAEGGGQSSGGKGSQIKRNIQKKPQGSQVKSVSGTQVGANSVSKLSEAGRDKAYTGFMAAIEDAKKTARTWVPDRPSVAMAKQRRAYEIRQTAGE